jgi:hypothetical protein
MFWCVLVGRAGSNGPNSYMRKLKVLAKSLPHGYPRQQFFQVAMSHLWNPLAVARQLEERVSENGLPSALQDSIRYYTVRLTQAAGILLQLPQAIVAQALITLYRFWVAENLMAHEFSVRNNFFYIKKSDS